MIWFACKACGKSHGRPEGTSGSLVFCECGQSNRVPWESTIAEPEPERPTRTPEPTVPDRIPFQDEQEPPAETWRRRRRWQKVGISDKTRCFNHQGTPSTGTCADCGEAFCAACVVALQGATLCGPCKNYRIRRLNRPGKLSVLALVAVILAPIPGFAGCLLTCMGLGSQSGGVAGLLGVVSVLAQLIVPFLGGLALWQIERTPRMSGRPLAIAALVGSLVGIMPTLVILVITARYLQ
jgi:hypothetical protein